MYQFTCRVCKASFSSKQPRTQYCSPGCRKTHHRRVYRRQVVGEKLSTKTVRFIAEMAVASDLLKKGYAVFQALSPACLCNLVAIKGRALYKIDVKTGYKSITGKLCFSATSKGNNDLFAVWERNSGKIFYITPSRREAGL